MVELSSEKFQGLDVVFMWQERQQSEITPKEGNQLTR